MEWDEDKGELVEVSSESYEHEGDVALCLGGGGGPNTDPHPYHYGTTQPGGKLTSTLPTATSLPGYWKGAEIPGISDAYKGQVSAIGESATKKTFDEGWYSPYYKAAIEEPLSAIQSTSAAHTMGQFSPWEDVFSTAEGLPQNVVDSISGIAPAGALVPKEGLGSGLRTVTDMFGDAEALYDETMTDLQGQEEDVEYTKKEDLLQHTIDRRKALSGRGTEFEQARAPIATSGMAYSGPAQEAYKDYKEGNIKDLADIQREQISDLNVYKSEIDRIEGERTTAVTERDESKEDAANQLSGLIEGTMQPALGDINQMAGDITQSHYDFGRLTEGGHKHGRSKIVGTSIGKDSPGGGYFSETGIPEIAELDAMTQASNELIKNISQGGLSDYIASLFPDSGGMDMGDV